MGRLWLVSLVAAASLAAPTAAAAAEDPAVATIYDPAKVGIVDLAFSAGAMKSLEDEPDEDVAGTFAYATTDGIPGGAETTLTPAPIAIEAHLKGSVGGSFRPISAKAAFKLKFKPTPFLGLKKMTLNNMVQDDSMLHEGLAYATFGAAGVPSSRSGYAYVRVNGEDFGLYANVETLDKVWLEKRFGPFQKPPQHLYEGERGHDVLPGQADDFEVDEGDGADVSDLETLIEAVDQEEGPKPWSTRMALYVDLEEMTKMWAVEKYIDHWDGYSGHASAGLRPNNYYLYSDATGRFRMLPWGADQTYVPTIGVAGREVLFDGEGGVLFSLCLADAACFRMYWEALGEVTEVAAALDPAAIAAAAATLLEPWEELEREDGRAEFTEAQVEEGVDVTVAFIEGRGAEAEAWLAANEPREAGGGATAPAAPSVDSSIPSTPLPPRGLGLGRVRRSGQLLRVEVAAPRPGALHLVATMAVRRGEAPVCADRRATVPARTVSLHCKLSPAALARLADRPLRLKLTATLESSAAPSLSATRFVRFPRD